MRFLVPLMGNWDYFGDKRRGQLKGVHLEETKL